MFKMLNEKLITNKELQELLNVSRYTIYDWMKEGMPHIKIKKTVRFNKTEVEKWLLERTEEEE